MNILDMLNQLRIEMKDYYQSSLMKYLINSPGMDNGDPMVAGLVQIHQ